MSILPSPRHRKPIRSRGDQPKHHFRSKDLLLWHFRLGHMGFARLQQLMRPRTVETPHADADKIQTLSETPKPLKIDPCIIPKNPSTRTCKPPLCASCQIAKAKRRPTDVSTTVTHQEALLKIEDLAPGTRVSVDQYESAVRGRLATSQGKENFGHKFAGGTIFCDHASGFIQCYHQVSLRATDTIAFPDVDPSWLPIAELPAIPISTSVPVTTFDDETPQSFGHDMEPVLTPADSPITEEPYQEDPSPMIIPDEETPDDPGEPNDKSNIPSDDNKRPQRDRKSVV